MFWNAQGHVDCYRATLRALAELEWWFAAQRAEREGRLLADALAQYTDLHYFSTLYARNPDDDAAWRVALDKATARPDGLDWLFARYLEPRLAGDLRAADTKRRATHAGFHYEFRPLYYGPADGDCLTLHFVNYFTPESPFAHREALAEGLSVLLDEAARRRPDIDRVQCATWLNHLPAFLGLFPSAWRESAFDCLPMTGSTGWWGQFIDRRGGFHQARAEAFRREGDFVWPNRCAVCRLDALRDHLETVAPAWSGAVRAG